MRWGKIVEKWLGSPEGTNGKKLNLKTIRFEVAEYNDERIQRVCDDLGEEADREAIQMLMCSGLQDAEIEEVVKASNILNCDSFGDLDLEVEKMFAEEVLVKYGFEGADRFQEQLCVYRDRASLKAG